MIRTKANIATRKKHILLKIFISLLLLLLLLSTATYTWFAISQTPTVNNMAIYINSNAGMSISFEPDNQDSWGQHLDYSQQYPRGSVLRPVTYSYENDCFYAARYGSDGRLDKISVKLSDTKNANLSSANGYYVKFTFYAHTDNDVDVSLLDAKQQTGTYVIGTPVWNGEEILHENGGAGAEYAIRVGLRITPLTPDGKLIQNDSRFIIYEPNSTDHDNYSGDHISTYLPTPSIDESMKTLVPEKDLIRQSSTIWTEADPVQKDVVVYKYGKFLDDTALFSLKADETVKIDMYLWLEGQDPDCTNRIGDSAQIFSSIQFFAKGKEQSGMDEIK